MKTKQIPVVLDQSAPAKNISRQGSHNAIRLACALPPELKGIDGGSVTFQKDGLSDETVAVSFSTDVTQPVYVEKGVVYVLVWRDLTKCRRLRLQVFGDLPGGGVLPSSISQPLRFDKSLDYDIAVKAPPDILTDLLAKAHKHPNLSTLDRIGEDADGLPTWDGEAWPGGDTCSCNTITRERIREILYQKNGDE